MLRIQKQSGFSMIEILVTTLLMSIVLTAGSLVFMAGQSTFSLTSARADIQENARRTLQRISFELQESGQNSAGVLQVSFLNNTGSNGTDLLRFSIPICVCGVSPIDSSGNVNRWGAPLLWGKAGCSTSYPLNAQATVDICHTGAQNISVVSDAVKAHLAHGDYLGACNGCSTTIYTNRLIEYQLNASGQLLRRVLDSTNNNALVSSTIFAEKLTDFQISFNAAQNQVTVSIALLGKASSNRTITVSNSMNVLLRNF